MVPGISPHSENGMSPKEFEEKAIHTDEENGDRPEPDAPPSKADRLVERQITNTQLSAG